VLQAWLEQHKRYPRRARLQRLEGTAKLRFVMNRQGRVLDYEIVAGSGHPLPDEAAIAMIQRAEPLPAIPGDMKLDRLPLVVPVRFDLR
jgi:protein TonB